MVIVRRATREEKRADYGTRYMVVNKNMQFGCGSIKQVKEVLLDCIGSLEIKSFRVDKTGQVAVKFSGVDWQIEGSK